VWAGGEIAKRTSNRYSIDVFPASQLGNETQINQALSLGTVDMIYTGQAFAARTHPPISIGGAPYMFRDLEHWKKFSQSKVLAELNDAYFKKGGNKPIAAFYYGVRHTTANKAINKPEDMKGLKLRVPDAPLYIMYPKIAGANATPIAFAEVYLALQNKTVDAQENPLPTILAKKFYEVQTHVNLTGHITEMLLAIVGGHVWSKLSDADKKAFTDVFNEAAVKSNAEIEKSENQLATDFGTKYGRTVVKSDREAFKKVFAPFHVGKDVPWDKALYDRVQAIK
jgi:tripartite ATP-independent transporter DctP family solute receptor